MKKFAIFPVVCLILCSCVNPDAEYQNKKIELIEEKNQYLDQKIKDANDKIKDLEEDIDILRKEIKAKSVYKRNTKKVADSINVNLKINKIN